MYVLSSHLIRLFARDPSAVALVVANLYVGVAALSSDRMLRILLFVYCAELCIVALYGVLKLVRIKPIGGLLLAPFFLIPHCFFIAMFFTVIFFIADQQEQARLLGLQTDLGEVFVEIARPTILLVVSHGLSFWQNFLGRREYDDNDLAEQIEESYRRVSWIWLAALPIGILVAVFQAPAFGALLVLVKTALDLYYHFKLHGLLPADTEEPDRTGPAVRMPWAGPVLFGAVAVLVVVYTGPIDRGAERIVDWHRARRPPPPAAQQQCTDGDYFNCKRGCELGFAASCHSLAFMYERGVGVDENEPRAAALYEKACDLNHGRACFNLAWMLTRGEGRLGNPARAVPLLERACNAGEGQACSSLGHIHADGRRGYRRNEDLARQYFARACKQGDERVGCYYLARIQEAGSRPDPAQAVRFYLRSCNAAGGMACRRAAGLYERGEGVPADLTRALELYRNACEHGDDDGCLARDRLSAD
jgi:hypothetical protein